jgi:hypothetical protein
LYSRLFSNHHNYISALGTIASRFSLLRTILAHADQNPACLPEAHKPINRSHGSTNDVG